MNTNIRIIGAATLLFSYTVLASESFIDYGRVLSTKPIYRSIKTHYPEHGCQIEHRHNRHYTSQNSHSHRANTAPLIGAIVGGVLGHQIGHGRARNIATVTGAVVGASVADTHSSVRHKKNRRDDRRHHRHNFKTCETNGPSHYSRKLVGYNVTYKYKGEIFHTQMDRHPGKRIRLSINITPLD